MHQSPTHKARRKVNTSTTTVLADSASLSVTPLARNKFPNTSIPIRGADFGTSKVATIKTIIGKIIVSSLETSRTRGFIYILRSLLVVSNFIIGG